ncbi:hypothetical protein U1701_12460 [Sphingomonas sp. PB2P19]|uniref:hypothetical protein n=1 Tax=Sphingomonas rhamnosi TaxID=3096156 RepID=UPI002FCB2347
MQTESNWWERQWVSVALALACAVPLLWPALPPLSDLPGHMARWHIATALAGSADLQRYYDYHWALIPNLGMDLLVPALAAILGLEPATKVAVIAIPVMTAGGLLWMAREVHGRVPPTALFALPLVYAWPFQFGFVNFALSQGLAFCAFALWVRLGRQERFAVRAAVFVPIACVLWIAHSFGWGMFGLMAGGAELARLRARGSSWGAAVLGAGAQCASLTVPIVFMLGGGGAALGADDWFNIPVKILWVTAMLRDRWQWFDLLSLVPLLGILYVGARSRALGFAPMLGWPAMLCLAAFVALPRLLMGGAYVDMRMAPAAVMLAIVAIAPARGELRFGRTLAAVGLAVLIVRLLGGTVSFAERSAEQQRELAAVESIPRGAAVLSLIARPCPDAWSDLRRDQLGSIAVVRRDAFVNGQWALPGQQLLRIRHTQAAPYLVDPSQQVLPARCADIGSNFAVAIARFPRAAFDYVWTIGFPPGAARASDLRLAWTDGRSALYRVAR